MRSLSQRSLRLAAGIAMSSPVSPTFPSTTCALSIEYPHTLSTSPVWVVPLGAARRHRGFHFYLNLEDPNDTRRHVDEDLARLSQEHKEGTSAYLHALLNEALAYYQAGDYIRARTTAERTHTSALAHNAQSSLIYLTATTCAKCCATLADEYEAHVKQREEDARTSPTTLAPKPSAVFAAERAIRKLRTDATRYEAIASRVFARPGNAFMRGDSANGRSSHKSQKDGQHGYGDHSTRTDFRRSFSEDGCDVDLDWERMYGGERGQQRRRRPEHAELRRHQMGVAGTGGWRVPK